MGRQKRKPKRIQYETLISWFVLVSVLDIVLTFLILRYSAEGRTRSTLIEGNPIARWILQHAGFAGMAVFKLLITGFVCVIAEVVGQHRPVLGARLLRVGTLIVAAVVVYSVLLLSGNVNLPYLNGWC
ncbi:MAG: DUF5658 family protein [Planctomycetaceae bacterium]|nr:DUF5658 family protein [Planctomycetaceae bacterium]